MISAQLADHDPRIAILSRKGRRIEDCVGCETCIRRTSRCVHDEDAGEILDQLVAADGIILASPVYLMHITGKLKRLIDKTASWVHRPLLEGKPVLVAALSHLEKAATQWGAHPTGRIGRGATYLEPVSERRVRCFVQHLRQPTSAFRPSLRQLIFCQVQKVLALKISALDLASCTERGWDEQDYHHPCHVPLHKRLIARLFYRMLYKRVQPVARL